jgi:hypothetical protein
VTAGYLKSDAQVLFQEIINLDLTRILCRLWSKDAKGDKRKHGRPPVLGSLIKVVHDKIIACHCQLEKQALIEIQQRAIQLYTLFVKFEEQGPMTKKGKELLYSILLQAYELTSHWEWSQILSLEMGCQLENSLQRAIGKLGKYYSISCSLMTVAKKTGSMLKQIRVEAYKISPEPRIIPSYRSNLGLVLQETVADEAWSDLKVIKSLTEACIGMSFASLEQEFASWLSMWPSCWKLHAKIQILLYYETYPKRQKPQVICLSKSTCYLYNLFIGLYGQFYVPGCHGVLYEKWTLPA